MVERCRFSVIEDKYRMVLLLSFVCIILLYFYFVFLLFIDIYIPSLRNYFNIVVFTLFPDMF